MAFAKLGGRAGGRDEMKGWGPSKARRQKPLAFAIYVPDGGHTMQPPRFPPSLCSPSALLPFTPSLCSFFFFIVTNSHPSSNSLFWFFNSVRRESEQDSKTGSQWDGRGWLWTFEGQGGGRNNAFCPLDGNHRGHNRSFQTSRRCWIHQFGLKMENHTSFILYKY